MSRFKVVSQMKTGEEALVCMGLSSADAMRAYDECLPDINLTDVSAFKLLLWVQQHAMHGYWKVVRTWSK